jgi:glucose-1-phosphate thymidylyltransferase
MQAGVREMMIIVTEQDLPRFEQLLKNGARLGFDIRYRIQPEPLGIPDAFHLTKDLPTTSRSC